MNVEAGNYAGTSWATAVGITSHATTPAEDAIVNGVVRMESTQTFTVSDQEAGSTDLSTVLGHFGAGNAGGTASLTAVSSVNVGTLSGAQSAIAVIDGALARVNGTV